MRCAVVRASKGYHSLKFNTTYIYVKSFIYRSSSLHPNQFKFIISTFHISLKFLNQFHITKYHLPSLQSNATTTTTLTLTYRCIVSSWGIQASNLLYMIWHCAPLYDEGANFPLWQSPERKPQFCFPLQNGNGWALHCQTTVGHFLSISRPMIPGLINPKRIISTNNCRLANRQLSSRDGT